MANRNAKLIERTLKDFSLGAMSGDGGSVIVDALPAPAQGVEGTTYLLRTPKVDLFEGHLYCDLFNNIYYIVSKNDANKLFYNEMDSKINLSKDKSGMVIRGVFRVGEWYTPDKWQDLFINSHCIIVSAEQDVLNLLEEYTYIFQDLGEVHLQDYKLIEIRTQNSNTNLAQLDIFQKNCLTQKAIVTNTNIQNLSRVLNTDSEAEHPYSFGEWRIKETLNKVGELTDKFIFAFEELQPLHTGDAYLINLTPTKLKYTYQEYVFDQGVYTALGGGSLYTIQVKGRTNGSDPENCSFTVQVDSKDIHTCQDLLDYLTDKGYYFNWTSGDGEGFILQATGQLYYGIITGIFTYSGEYISMQNTNPDGFNALDPETVEITYLGE